ncbi:AraC family transcriptional regulator [Algoriphagus resistens]|uniref:AraC family transcriptional regulator n=1 Tax=Algoriphagus resistens TaxID=1750590 RepID=UPI0007168CE7|nr:AraC family transcriptional regulator [Algoriphagus resistens]
MDFQTQFLSALRAYCTLRNVSLTPFHSLSNPSASFTSRELDSLWKGIMEQSGDQLFGLHFGESMQVSALGIVGQLITTSNTVGEALAKGASMVPLMAEGFELTSEVLEDQVKIELRANQEIRKQCPYYYKSIRDFIAALVIHELDGLINDKITPNKIVGPLSAHESDEYCRVLRCNDFQHADKMSISVDLKLMGIPVITANYRMQAYLKTLLLETSTLDLTQFESLKNRVSTYIMSNSYLKILSIDDVAANFNLSSRTLQRKLSEEGCSFKEIVDNVRKELALEYLKDRNNQIKDVAYSLGYNESSAFVRAFKRWTGTTPSLYF